MRARPRRTHSTRAKKYFERTLSSSTCTASSPSSWSCRTTRLRWPRSGRRAGTPRRGRSRRTSQSLRGRYRFHLLDYTDLATFHGSADEFYDGAHVTAANARRILVQAVKDAPEAFR